MGFKLRDYQQNAISKINEMNASSAGVIALPTGAGKTVVFSKLSAMTKGRVLIVVPSKELREQAIEKLEATDSSLDIGSVQAKLDEVDSDIIVATRQSLTHKKSNRLERMIDKGKFEIVIVDECHNAVNQIKRIKDNVNSDVKFIGFTATPFNQDMTKVFDGIIFEKPLLEMIREGYLCEPKALYVHSDVDLSGVKTVAGEFNQKQLEQAVNTVDRNELLLNTYVKYAKDRKSTIIFASGIDHSNEIEKTFKDKGIECRSVDSTIDDDVRDEIIEDFKNGKLPVIVNVGILTTGFDCPRTDCIIYARPTKSKILYTQILGRGLRNCEGKEDCLVIDIVDVMKKHDLMSMSDIFGVKIEDGETVSEAMKNRENERLQYEQELKAKEQERLRLIEEQVKLFKMNMGNYFVDAYYDWFKCNNDTFALSETGNTHYVIEKNDEDFIVYKVVYDKQTKETEEVNSGDNLVELIEFVENKAIERYTSFTYRKAKWKHQAATDNQRKYARTANTKWDAHKYFVKSHIRTALWKYKNN